MSIKDTTLSAIWLGRPFGEGCDYHPALCVFFFVNFLWSYKICVTFILMDSVGLITKVYSCV